MNLLSISFRCINHTSIITLQNPQKYFAFLVLVWKKNNIYPVSDPFHCKYTGIRRDIYKGIRIVSLTYKFVSYEKQT